VSIYIKDKEFVDVLWNVLSTYTESDSCGCPLICIQCLVGLGYDFDIT